MELSNLDWILIAAYLVLTLGVGFAVSGKASKSADSYFLADRNLPWWWAGISVAATTFAADTPLAITGIIASKGLSGNWFWLSWMGFHAAIIFLFARNWRRSEVLTDAQIIELRYSGPEAGFLRSFKAGFYGILFNCIVLGWVLKAMVKIVTPFFHWEVWLPGLVGFLQSFWPADFPLGTPSDALTIAGLIGLVAIYSSAGGIRGVIVTDLLQLGVALFGSYWLAGAVLDHSGGTSGLFQGLNDLYGEQNHYLTLFPSDFSFMSLFQAGSLFVGAYLLVQSFASNPSDGGGYLMQRLGTCKDDNHAKKAAALFTLIHYVVRIWPWMIVGLGALVLIPIGQEQNVFQGAVSHVAADRESAYPALIGLLLGPGIKGVLMVGLLGAFMSTVDTHINWGSSYFVNDFFKRLFPQASMKAQVRVARASVVFFGFLAIVVASQIDTIESAWQWVAALGAGVAAPTILRWFWWRINAWSELAAMVAGPLCAGGLLLTEIDFETRLVLTALAGIAATLAGTFFGRPTNPDKIKKFVQKIQPFGFWPQGQNANIQARFLPAFGGIMTLIFGLLMTLLAGQMILNLRHLEGAFLFILGLVFFFGSFWVEKALAANRKWQ